MFELWIKNNLFWNESAELDFSCVAGLLSPQELEKNGLQQNDFAFFLHERAVAVLIMCIS